jgi:HD-GYP domain-containing protein (c-di-GMP phosphodiesterase class II)
VLSLPKLNEGRLPILVCGLIISLLMAGLYIFKPSFLVFLEYKAYDILLKSTHLNKTTGIPVIVDIDEESIAQFGQWPWPRYRVASLFKKIQELGALSVAVDMVFAEPDRTSLSQLEQTIRRDFDLEIKITQFPEKLRDNDRILAKALSNGPFVLGYKFAFEGERYGKNGCALHPLNVIEIKEGGDERNCRYLFNASGAICNLDLLSNSVTHSGFFDAAPDSDGILRRVPLIIEYQEKLYPSLALATIMQAWHVNEVIYKLNNGGEGELRVDGATIPLDSTGNLLINYRGKRKQFDYVSAKEILKGTVAAHRLKNHIVLVGTSAAGLKELRSTPLDPTFPGVEVHATIIDNILQRDFLYRPQFSLSLELALVFLLGMSITFFLALTSPAWSMILTFAACVGIWHGSKWLLFNQGFFLAPAMPILTSGMSFSLLSFFSFWKEERKVKQRTSQLLLTQNAAILSLASLAETRDPETGGHIRRTQHYVKLLADHLRDREKYKGFLNEHTVDLMFRMAPLHDIGKVGVRDSILLKEGKLSFEEFEEIKKHTIYGYEALLAAERHLGDNSFLRVGREIAYTHHEKWDGSGYPQGLKGEEIPLFGRLMAIADVYDALISKRIYKSAVAHEEAVRIMADGRGTQFDPDILEAFLEIHSSFKIVASRFADSSEQHCQNAIIHEEFEQTRTLYSTLKEIFRINRFWSAGG